MARRWEGSGKALKAHGRVSCPGGPCFAAVLKPSKCIWRHGQALAKGCRCRATCVRADLEGSGKKLKAHGRVLCLGGMFRSGRQWQSAKGPREGFMSWWKCFAAVLKPSKQTMATWPGAGKAVAKR